LPTFLKPVLALVISVLIFAGFIYLVNDELQDFVQTRFYNPSVVNSYVKENTIDAELVHNHIIELQDRFLTVLSESAIRSSFLYNQSAEDIYERSRIFRILLESVSGLQSVQFIDSNGIRIHFSTSSRDILSQSRDSTSFRNYNEDPLALPFEFVAVQDGENAKYSMDEQGERIIFSFPFNDSMDVYRGTALFSVSIRALAERLIAEGRLNVSEAVSVIRYPPGIVLGSAEAAKSGILEKVSEVWSEGVQGRVVLDSPDSGVNYSLISFRTDHGVFFGRLINDYLFSISEPMKLILQLSIFLTFFLTLYFLINLKPNPVTVVRNRIKRLHDNLFQQLYVNKSSQDRVKWILELEQRREEIRKELKLNMKLNTRVSTTIDSIIDKSWDELLAVLKSSGDSVTIHKDGKSSTVKKVKKTEEIGEAEDLEEVEEAEALEEIDEVEEAEALEEIDEVEEVESLEEIDEVEEVEALEEIDEVEEVEALEEIDEVEEVESLEEIDEVEEVESLEEIDEVEEVEELEDIEEIEEADEVPVKAKPASPSSEGKGLLGKASKKSSVGKGLLSIASKEAEKLASVSSSSSGKGLLAAAGSKPQTRKGLLALASEIEFSRDYPVLDSETQELLTDVNIVSPFLSMFSDLSDTK